MKISQTHVYIFTLRELLMFEPTLKLTIQKIILLFLKNPKDTRLKTHALHGRLKGKYALHVTDDIRIIFEYIGKQHVRFLIIGTHEKVYPGFKKRN